MIHTMYVKNFNFLFKSMFLRKNCRTEKNWNSFAASPPEKQTPVIDQTPAPEFQQLFSPHLLLFFLKLDLPPI